MSIHDYAGKNYKGQNSAKWLTAMGFYCDFFTANNLLFLNNYLAFSQWVFRALACSVLHPANFQPATATTGITITVHAAKNDSQFLWISL